MTNDNSEASVSRRTVLNRTAGALAVGGGGLTAANGVLARQDGQSGDASGAYEGVTCGDDHAEGNTFTVKRRSESDSDVIQWTGLSPACITEETRLYVDLPDTEPTVWMSLQNGEIPPGTYRVDRAERCEEDAGECDGDDLYRLEFSPTED